MDNDENRNIKTGAGWLFKMAWRDGKASRKKLVLFIASIVLGIAAVVSIQSFSENLKNNISLQSKSLMGADYIIDSDKPINERVTSIIDSLGGEDAKSVGFASMAAFPKNGSTKLVQVKGITEGFPFYGKIETEPINAASEYQGKGGALVDATLMLQLDIQPGDSIKIGNIQLPVIGALKASPGSSGIFSSIAPPVIIPHSFIDKTGLVQTGSRINYDYYFVAPPEMDLELLDKNLDPILDAENADLDTHLSTSERLGRRFQNFGKFLNLVAFIALLLGCIGIASAINIYIKEKLSAIAILKCLGATRKQTFYIYLIQISFIGLIGGLLGTMAGLLLQELFPIIIKDLLPVDIEIVFISQVIIMGIILGVVMSILFASYPLISTLYISPLQALRVQLKTSLRSKNAGLFVLTAIFIFIYLFAFWLLRNWQYSLVFVAGTLVTFMIIAGIANLFMRAIKKYFPASWGFVSRQSLLNLFRPQNQTLILILVIGIATFLLSTLYFTKDLLLAQASIDDQGNNPNLILLDVQSQQTDSVALSISNNDLKVLEDIPIVTMRVNSIKGVPVNEIRKDTTSEINTWVLNHEFRTTYRDSIISSEIIEEGVWTSQTDGNGIIPISVSSNFAEDAQVEIGDIINFNVQGVLLETKIGSIRAVDWSRMQLNFSIVFPAGILEDAPQFRVLTTRTPNEASSAQLQRELVKEFPNISVLDLRQVLSVIENVLSRISWLINFMAFFSLITGIIVLLGAVRTSKYQRARESVLLRTLGARSDQIIRILAMEYFYLGILGSTSGILLSLISSQLLALFVFETSFIPSFIPFLVILPGVTILVMLIGISNSLSVIKSPPLEVLRKELN
ncbi:ABC transporter permease [Christiangramia salexigens]|uniref:ABC transporter permease n=1 Tax=Christiangramia salexigens TaxID=1913577 RepID=A0A1L3J2H2_9FLAO|nr:FtsX-like permease family protein [Christiangramia salexigens]APG59324.1 hypothetical protein LPB144_02355 [Christiangramia salexigens]